MGYAPSSAPPAADPLAFKSFDAGEAGALGGGIGQQQQQGSGTGRAVGAHGSGSGGGACDPRTAPALDRVASRLIRPMSSSCLGYSTFFNIEYYQYLFDIDATEVVQRWYVCLPAAQEARSAIRLDLSADRSARLTLRSTKALIPVPSKPTGSFVQDVCDGRPDLYGKSPSRSALRALPAATWFCEL